MADGTQYALARIRRAYSEAEGVLKRLGGDRDDAAKRKDYDTAARLDAKVEGIDLVLALFKRELDLLG